jgi:hypothetical protein
MREMMRRDALQDEMDEEEEQEEEDDSGRLRMKSGAVAASSGGAVPVAANAAEDGPEKEDADTAEPPVDWQSHVSGVKRVLAMDVGGRGLASPQSREAQADDMLGHLCSRLHTSASSCHRCERTIFTAFGALHSTHLTRRWTDREGVRERTRMITDVGDSEHICSCIAGVVPSTSRCLDRPYRGRTYASVGANKA